jgi:hypothetical protein
LSRWTRCCAPRPTDRLEDLLVAGAARFREISREFQPRAAAERKQVEAEGLRRAARAIIDRGLREARAAEDAEREILTASFRERFRPVTVRSDAQQAQLDAEARAHAMRMSPADRIKFYHLAADQGDAETMLALEHAPRSLRLLEPPGMPAVELAQVRRAVSDEPEEVPTEGSVRAEGANRFAKAVAPNRFDRLWSARNAIFALDALDRRVESHITRLQKGGIVDARGNRL